MKGYLHVYTGDGKGKTTAALGLALRAIGAGFKVFVGQFVKGMPYSELNGIQQLGGDIVIRQYGRDCFIHNDPEEEDVLAARKGLEEMKAVLSGGDYRLVVLDEANIAVYYRLFSIDELIEAIQMRDEGVEVVVTGRKAEEKLMAMADLVTEMKEVKHYYQKKVEARKGIEM